MSDTITLKAQRRSVTGKQVARLRRAGITPIVVYGHATEPLALQADAKELHTTLARSGSSQLIALQVEGEPRPRMTLVRDFQRHITRFHITHADFLQVAMDQTVRSEVHLEFVGEPELAQRHEALVDHGLTHVTIEALPADLPSSVVVDCSGLEHFGDTICIGDLTTEGSRFQILHEPETIVVRLLPISRGVGEFEAPVEVEAAEPEVLTERRRDEDED
jgi:large subunit ribosomal protein L25